MNSILFNIFFTFFFCSLLLAQNDDVRVVGDKLTGKVINGENVRIVDGNVVITQQDVRITCDKAIQYFTQKKIELIDNVVITQDSVKIETEKAFYFSDSKYAFTETFLTLQKGNSNLEADRGEYFTEEELAIFYGNVSLVDTSTNLKSQKLYYYSEIEKIIAIRDVNVFDDSSSLFADSLIYYRNSKFTNAFKNVSILDIANRLTIFGEEFLSEGDSNKTIITGSPFLFQVDSSDSGRKDTLFIKAERFETSEIPDSRLVATDSVKIIRGLFSSVSNSAVLFRDDDIIEINRLEKDVDPPVLWHDNSQLVGDSIKIYLKSNSLDYVDIRKDAFILSRSKEYPERYDQISGKKIIINFDSSKIKRTDVTEDVLSIYFTYDEGEPNGLIKSSAERTILDFKENQVVKVRMYGDPISEYHPENLIEGIELEFSLPSFFIYSNRPNKELFIELLNERKTKTAK
ncbi:MAG: LPS export ABC transporter periplasmic protein LptC [Melioribacteraceae bacterium]|nr:LPS export ABC transporter periplasmic protein LptC [Melioribacteraceae bacterium]